MLNKQYLNNKSKGKGKKYYVKKRIRYISSQTPSSIKELMLVRLGRQLLSSFSSLSKRITTLQRKS